MATPGQHNNDTGSPGQVDRVNQVVQTSRLLSLPAELRNRIYMFALTADNGFIGHRYSPNLNLVVVTHRGRLSQQTFNKLKFVCKQLWAETKMLELIYNTVHFGKSALLKNKPILFMKNLSPNHRACISSIRICEDSGTMLRSLGMFGPGGVVAPEWQQFIKFSELNPRIKMQVVLSDWRMLGLFSRHRRFWGVGCQIADLSNREDTVQFIATATIIWSQCHFKVNRFRSVRQDQDLAARFKHIKNVTFFPRISEAKKECIVGMKGKRVFNVLEPGEFYNHSAWGEKWRKLGLSWVTEGIQLGWRIFRSMACTQVFRFLDEA